MTAERSSTAKPAADAVEERQASLRPPERGGHRQAHGRRGDRESHGDDAAQRAHHDQRDPGREGDEQQGAEENAHGQPRSSAASSVMSMRFAR